MHLGDLVGHRVQLLPLGLEDHVVVVHPGERHVGRDHHHVQIIDPRELFRLGVRGSGHAGKFGVHAEVVLDGDGGQRLVLLLDLDLLLGLHRLVQPVAPAASGHQAAGKLVHDDDLVILQHVVHIPLVQGVGPQTLLNVVHEVDVGRLVEVLDPEELLHREDARLGHGHRLGLLVHDVVARDGGLDLVELPFGDGGRPLQPWDDPVDDVVLVGGFLRGARDDQRGPGLVDQDVVHLVHDAVVRRPLDEVLGRKLHVVAQIIEAEFAIGPVGDVGPVSLLPRAGSQVRQAGVGRSHGRVEQEGGLVLEYPHAEPQGVVHRPHPLGVALGQIVVHRDDVRPATGEGIEVGRQRRHQRLPLARGHLGDLALVQHHPADELGVEMAHVQHAARGLATDREGVRQDLVENRGQIVVCCGGHTLFEYDGLGAQLRVAQYSYLGFQGIDALDSRAEAL